MKKNKSEVIGILDIGSNSVRLMLTNGNFFTKNLITTRLGEGLSSSKSLKIEAMERTVQAIVKLKEFAKTNGANEVYAFATQAVRESDNGKDFCRKVLDETGITVDVVDGKVEAELGLSGALKGNIGGIIDIGGASTEIAYSSGKEILYEKSLPIGVVKIYDMFKNDTESINAFLSNKVLEYGKTVSGEYYGIGGTATSLGAIIQGLKVYDSKIVDKTVITKTKLEEISNILSKMTPTEIVNEYPVDIKRADVIYGGSLILLSVMNYLKLDKITVSEGDNLEGYYYKLKSGIL